MSEKDPMTIDERRKDIHKMWGRYRDASRKEKRLLLDEMMLVTGMHRKSLIRIIKGRLSCQKRETQRGTIYGAAVADAVRVIARSLDYPCAERLKPNLVWLAKHLVEHKELVIKAETFEKLEQISISTLKRLLKRIGRSEEKIADRKPSPGKRNSL